MLHMPLEFKGKATRRTLTCGICQKVYGFRKGRTVDMNRRAAREMGWTYRDDLGWVCPCRHRCENLSPNTRDERGPVSHKAREATTQAPSSRRYPAPSPNKRERIRKRNSREIE